MTATSTVDRAAVSAAAEARRRKHRRRVIGFWVSIVAMLLVIATAVVLSIGFNNSWWVKSNPVASHDQIAPDGSSVFTQAGIDYYTRTGVVRLTMTSERPSAAELGLPASGSKHLDFLVPLAVTATGARPVDFTDVDGLDLITSGGKLTAVELRPNASYAEMLGQVRALAPKVGWSADVVDGTSAIGGGSAPGTGLPTRLVAIARNGLTADALEEHLRRLDPPVVARIEHDRVVLDLRTVEPEDDHKLATLLISSFGMRPPPLVE